MENRKSSLNKHIGIVLATHNPEAFFLEEQIKSIKNQSHDSWQCVVTDDHSSEENLIKIKEMIRGDERFKLVHLERESGAYKNFENGLEKLPDNIDYVSFCDHDDIWEERKLEDLLECIDRCPEATLVHSDATIIDGKGKEIHNSLWDYESRNIKNSEFRDLLIRNNVTGCTAMFKKNVIDASLPFPEQPPGCNFFHDQWVALNASLMGKILFCPQKLIRYRKHGKNLVGPRVKPSALIFMKPHVFISEAKKQWRTTKELKRIMANHIFSSTSKFYCERKINWDGLKEDRSLQNIVSYFFKDVIRFTKIYFISVGGVLNYLEGLFFRGKGKGSFESTQIAGPYSQKEFNEFLNYHKYLLNKSWKGELYRNFYLYPLLKKSLKGRVLDIGCGIGDFLRSRPKTLGIDINPYNIEMCHDKGLPACLVSSYDYPFSDKEFDGAIIDNVLEHLEDPAPMLSEVNRVMKIGGVVVIGVPGIKGFEADSDHKIYYDPKRLEDTAFRFGFKLKKIMHLPFKSKYLEENFKRYIYYGAFEKVDDYKI